MSITRHCKVKFAISVNFVDEVKCNVTLLDACETIGIPYLRDRDILFYKRQKNIVWSGGTYFINADKRNNYVNKKLIENS